MTENAKEVVQRLYDEAAAKCSEGTAWEWELKFAEAIARECILTIQREIVRNGNTPENLRSYQHIESLAKKFEITLE